MKYNLQIELLDECDIEQIYINKNGDINNIQLLISPDKNLNDILSKSGILKMLKGMINEYNDDPLMIEYYNQYIKSIMDSDFNIIDNCESILILPNELVQSYIKNNPFLQNRKIYLNEIYSVNRISLNKVKALFGDNKNIYVKIKGNHNYISILDYEKTVNEIEKISAKIEKYDLSPLEQLIFAYDLVRDRVYVRESVDKEYILDRLKYYENIFFCSKLMPTVFLNALYKVRKLEYYEESEKYKFDLDTLKEMALSNIKTTKDIFVMMSYYKSNNFESIIKQNNIEIDMQRVKLTKILKNIKK